MKNESSQIRVLILIAAALCAVLIGYNAFYLPNASLSELKVTADPSSAAESVSNSVSSPTKSETGVSSSDSAQRKKESGSSQSVQPQKKININTAALEQLESLDGIGETLAKRIVAYRTQHGNFKSAIEIKNVSGIGDKKYEAIRNFITVS
jgi:competence protein ComEA